MIKSASALLLLLLAACATPGQRPNQSDAQRTATDASPVSTAGAPWQTIPARPTTAPTPGAGMFVNPVMDEDFADPDTLKVGDTYYAYATNFGTTNVKVARSHDLIRWELLKDALPALPSWSQPGYTWAPEVTTTADETGYVMYFTARHAASRRQCIGVAISVSPEGPFRSPGDEPFICKPDEGGSIDASSFGGDDGSRYLLWKNDGNCCGMETWIYLQAVSGDGLRLEGEPRRLIHADKAWEGGLVEAPTLWKHAGAYLFYSANRYSGRDYAIGCAVAEEPAGPYRKPDGPLLVTSTANGPVIGPGGQDVVIARDGEVWMLYHSWDAAVTYRGLSIDELVWEAEAPVVKGPDRTAQRAP